MYISYDYYKIFYYVAKYRSFTHAANVLMNNQPNMTRTIKNLEKELGVELFIRSKRSVSLTPEGERLYARIAVAMEQIQLGEEELSQNAVLQSGTVSIGASETALHLLLLPRLKMFRRKYPGIRIKISNHSTPQAISALKNGQADFAVVSSPTGIVKPLKEIKAAGFRDILIAGEEYSFLRNKKCTLKELQKYPLICLGKETKSYEFFSGLYLKHGLNLQADIEAATTDQILPMVKSNLGIGFVPEQLAKKELESGEVFQIELDETVPPRNVCIITDTKRSVSIAARELINTLTEKDISTLTVG